MNIYCISQHSLSYVIVTKDSKCLFLAHALCLLTSAVALFISLLSLAEESHMYKPDICGLG